MPKVSSFVLRRLRTKKKLSLERLAEMSKVDRQTLHRLEHDKQSENRAHTIRQIAHALDVEEGILTGDLPFPEPQAQYDVTLSRMNIKISTLARNALYLVADRYDVGQSRIVELAPFLFCWAAEASLRQRRNRLEQADSNRSEEMFEEELDSISCRDLFGEAVSDNPFEAFLRNLAADIGEDATLDVFSFWDYAEYRICVEDAALVADGDSDLTEEILSGRVALHEMPKELRESGMCKERAKWARDKADEYRQNLARRIERALNRKSVLGKGGST